MRIVYSKRNICAIITDMDEAEVEQMFSQLPVVVGSYGKEYVVLEQTETDEIRLYRDGSKRNKNGQLVEKPSWAVEITAETSRDYTKRRKERILEAIEQKLIDVTRTNVPAEAIAHIVGKRAEIAMTDEGKAGNDAARIVLQAVDAYQEKREQPLSSTTRHEYSIDAETRELLEQMLQERRQYIDVRSTDME